MGFTIYFLVSNSLLALTPAERWRAAGRFDSNFMGERWFFLTAVAAIVILTALLVVVSLFRIIEERRAAERQFVDNAERRGLSTRECQILLGVASKAGLRRSDAIFTMEEAFDHGSTRMIGESVAQHKKDEDRKQLRSELSFLREKLGFRKQRHSAAKSRKVSSRQIPVGKKVYITRRITGSSGDIDATVVENNDMELTVRSTVQVKITFGEFWRVRYYFGPSIWEFDTAVLGCEGDILVLNHSDDVRFINRRRFLRVPVSQPAFVARFPFTRPLSEGGNGKKGSLKRGLVLSDTCRNSWGPPEFVPGVVTELAGPGLRLEAPLKIEAGDRVLVVLRLDEENGLDSVPARRKGRPARPKIVEDIGEVRHTRAAQNGLSIAVELTGLSDADVAKLIRATNLASLRARVKTEFARGSLSAEESAAEPVPMRGV